MLSSKFEETVCVMNVRAQYNLLLLFRILNWDWITTVLWTAHSLQELNVKINRLSPEVPLKRTLTNTRKSNYYSFCIVSTVYTRLDHDCRYTHRYRMRRNESSNCVLLFLVFPFVIFTLCTCNSFHRLGICKQRTETIKNRTQHQEVATKRKAFLFFLLFVQIK